MVNVVNKCVQNQLQLWPLPSSSPSSPLTIIWGSFWRTSDSWNEQVCQYASEKACFKKMGGKWLNPSALSVLNRKTLFYNHWNNQPKQEAVMMQVKTASASLGNIGREIARKLARFLMALALTQQHQTSFVILCMILFYFTIFQQASQLLTCTYLWVGLSKSFSLE